MGGLRCRFRLIDLDGRVHVVRNTDGPQPAFGTSPLNSLLYEPQFHIVLHEPEIPQNTGNVGRTCVAIGAQLWLIHPLGFQLDQKQLRRAGLDYWQHLVWRDLPNWESFQEEMPTVRRWFFTKTAERDYRDADFQPQDVLVFGSESRGLPESVYPADDSRRLRIPIRPQVRSLNLSAAVAVAAFEAVRQCR